MASAIAVPPTNIKALRQKHADLRGKLRLISETAQTQRRELSDDEARMYTETKNALEVNAAKLAIAEDALEAARNQPGGAPVSEEDRALADFAARGSRLPQRAPNGTVRGGRKYREMFGADVSRDGWDNPSDFFRVLHTGMHDARLRPASFSAATNMGESVPSDGGFYVPTQLVAQMLDASLESEIVRPRCQLEPMVSETKKIVGFDGSDHTNGTLYGGISINWSAELATPSAQKTKTRLIQLTANKIFILCQISNELIQDGGDFETLLTQALINACSFGLDSSFLTGSGAGRPLGVLNAKSLITIAKESSQPVKTIVFENVTKAFARLHPACVRNAVWIANSTTIPQLLALQNRVFNLAQSEVVGGAGTPAIQTAPDGSMTLLTRPVLITEKTPALGTSGDLILADLSQYSVGIRKEASLEKSIHAGFSDDSSWYRMIMRVDGQPRWSKAVTPVSGDSLSWAVAIADRTS